MKRQLILLVSLLVSCCCQAEIPPNVNQKVFTAVTGSAVSSSLPNIGQSYHNLSVVIKSSGGTCSAGNYFFYVRLEGSFDAVSWATITTVTQANHPSLLAPPAIFSADGVGVYPYLRANVADVSGANCAADVYYQGSLYPVYTQQKPAAINQYSNNTTQVTGGTGSTHNFLVPTGLNVGTVLPQIAIYGLIVLNNGTSTETLSVYGSNTGFCTGVATEVWINLAVLPANGQLILPTSTLRYYESNPGSSLCLDTAASSAAHSVQAVTVFRYE